MTLVKLVPSIGIGNSSKVVLKDVSSIIKLHLRIVKNVLIFFELFL